MSEFQTTPKPLEMDEPTYQDRLKNLKELKVANGNFVIDENGMIGRDSDGNITFQLDLNG
jgi:hypothetical protein